MRQICDWCKNVTAHTSIVTHGSNWDIFEDICDTCVQRILNLRRSRMLYPKEAHYTSRCYALPRLLCPGDEEEKEKPFKLPKSLGGE